ncbi:exosortase F system-associated membrane protein [Dawidia soli]|uniref:Exosortase F system-associated protein n=1 Tax=Dawidia soli TaxID=2782352 RepID=A0AAP2DCJ6_9BACT|nr:exosortase F system-associated protein [Dawidia soli]MBT1688315.1 exosortase F system-associated protein [Dawidia soli]
MPEQDLTRRWLVGGVCATGLVLVFLFQRLDLAGSLHLVTAPVYKFLINRTVRFLLNDLLAIGLLYALFYERKYVIFALWTQLVGTALFLMPYFILKLYFPSYNGPLISYLHRLILNPTLLLLLIPAFYYQRSRSM